MPALSVRRILRELKFGAQSTDANERGQCLERLMAYVLKRVPGLRHCDSRIRTVDGSEEIDIAFWNDKAVGGLHFADHILLVECKNWKSRVTTIEVTHFAEKLHQRHLRMGLLVAAQGVTGSDSGRAATSMIQRAYIRDQIAIVVISHEELARISSTESLVRLIQSKISEIVLQAVI